MSFSDDSAGGVPGLLVPGNLDLMNRPRVKNPDGTISTVRSASYNLDGYEVLLPTISDDGNVLDDAGAVKQFRRTGNHLGLFDSPDSATAYAQRLHEDQARMVEQESNPFATSTLADAPPPVPEPRDPWTMPPVPVLEGMLTDEEAGELEQLGGPDAAPEKYRGAIAARYAQYREFRRENPRKEDLQKQGKQILFLQQVALNFDKALAGRKLNSMALADTPEEKQAAKDMLVANLFLRARIGGKYSPVMRDTLRDAIAVQMFKGDGQGSDAAFSKAATKWATTMQNKRRLLEVTPEDTDAPEDAKKASLSQIVATAALSSDPKDTLDSALATWQAGAKDKDGFDPEELPNYRAAAKMIFDPLRKQMEDAKPIVEAAMKGFATESETAGAYGGDELVELVMKAPEPMRPYVLAMINAEAKKHGDKEGEGWHFWNRFGRGFRTYTMTSGNRVKYVEQLTRALKIMDDPKRGAGESEFGLPALSVGVQDYNNSEQMKFLKVTTPEEIARSRAYVVRELEKVKVNLALEQIGNQTYSPLKGGNLVTEHVLYPFAESMAPQIAMAFLTRRLMPLKLSGMGAGAAMVAEAAPQLPLMKSLMADQNAQFFLNSGNVSVSRAYELADTAANYQTGLEYAQTMLATGGLKNLGQAFRKGQVSRWRTFGKQMLLQGAEQNFIEGAQDITPAILAAIKQDTGVDLTEAFNGRMIEPEITAGLKDGKQIWKAGGNEFATQAGARAWAKERAVNDGSGYWSQRIDTFWAVLPAVVMGAVAKTHSTRVTGAALGRVAADMNDTLLHAAGIREEARAAILAHQDPAERLDAFDTARKSADRDTAREGGVRLAREQAEASARYAREVSEAGIKVERVMMGEVPVIQVTAPDGKVTSHATAADAMETVGSHMAERDEPFLTALGKFAESAPAGRTLEISRQSSSLLDELDKAVTEGADTDIDAIWERADTFRRSQDSQAAPLERDAASESSRQELAGMRVLGRSRTEFAGKVARSVSTIMEGGGIVDMVEEEAENDLRESIGRRQFGWQDMASALRQVEAVTGDTYLHGDSETAVTEGWSALVRLYATGTRRARGGNEITGAVRGEAARDARDARRRLRAAETGGKLKAGMVAALKDYLAWMKATFGQVSRLMKARREGRLSSDIETEIRKSLRLDQQDLHEEQAGHEADALYGTSQEAAPAMDPADEWIDDSQFDALPPLADGSTDTDSHLAFSIGKDVLAHNEALRRPRATLRERMADEYGQRPENNILFRPDRFYRVLSAHAWADAMETGYFRPNPSPTAQGYTRLYASEGATGSRYRGQYVLEVDPSQAGEWLANADASGYHSAVIGSVKLDGAVRVYERQKDGSFRVIHDNIGDEALLEREPSASGASFSISPRQDAEYMAAVESGDMERAQVMVEEAARAAGYNVGPLWHGTNSGKFEVFDKGSSTGYYFTPDKDYAAKYGKRLERVYLRVQNGVAVDVELTPLETTPATREKLLRLLAKHDGIQGYPSQGGNREVLVRDPSQIKSAEPVTRDAAGSVIPLSERFNPGDARMSYSISASRAVPEDTSAPVTQLPDGSRIVGPTTFAISAYHGTPHKVDKFSTAKIGTGEGAQAFGWGLYFATDEAVAKWYRETLATKPFLTRIEESIEQQRERGYITDEAMTADAAELIATTGGRQQALDLIRSRQDTGTHDGGSEGFILDKRADQLYALASAVSAFPFGLDAAAQENPGNLYAVGIEAEHDDFLKWDEPLSEQSADVRTRLAKIGDFDQSATGGTIYKNIWEGLIRKGKPEPAAVKLKRTSERILKAGIPGITYRDGASRGPDGKETPHYNYVIFDENLVRIAMENGQAVTQGQPSFSIAPIARLEQHAARLDAMARATPGKLASFLGVAAARLRALADSWTRTGFTATGGTLRPLTAPRTLREIRHERNMREAIAREEAEERVYQDFAHVLSAYTGAEDQIWAGPVMDSIRSVSSHPGRKSNHGMIRSKSAALRQGRDTGGDYDGIDGLPRFVFGGNESPDTVAQELFDQGLIEGPTPDDLWNGIRKELAGVQDWKDRMGKIEERLRDARKAAKAEAEAWEKDATAERESILKDQWNPHARMMRDLRTLDTILMALPPAVRGKVGGFVAVSDLKTDEARFREIGRRIDAVGTALETELKKAHTADILALFNRARPKADRPGEKRKGKASADVHTLLATAEAAMRWNAEQVEEYGNELEKALAMPDGLTPELEAFKRRELALVEQVGNWAKLDSARREAAVKAVTETFEGGWLDWSHEIIRRREERDARRGQAFADVSTTHKTMGTDAEVQARGEEASTLKGKLKRIFDRGFSWGQQIAKAFGEDSATHFWAESSVIGAENGYTDSWQDRQDRFQAALKAIMGGGQVSRTRELERLSTSHAVPGAPGTTPKMSQMDAVHYTMLWRDPDSREWLTSHGFGETFQKAAENYLSPAAQSIRAWLVAEYDAQYHRINEVYRRQFGIDMPRVQNYAPRMVEHGGATGELSADPAALVATLAAGFTRRRRPDVKSRPTQVDALSAYWSNAYAVEHYIHWMETHTELRAVFSHADTQNAVKSALGKPYAHSLNEWIENFANQAASNIKGLEHFQKWMRSQTDAALVGKLGVLAKQIPAAYGSAAEIGWSDYLTSLRRILTGQSAISLAEMGKSATIQRRKHAMGLDVAQALSGKGETPLAAFMRALHVEPRALRHALNWLRNRIGWADAFFTTLSATAAYDSHFRDGKEAGLSDEEAHAQAQKETDTTVHRTAQPEVLGAKSLFEASLQKSVAGRVFFAFQSANRQALAMTVLAGQQGKRGKLASRLLTHWVITGIVTQAVGAMIRTALSGDEPDEIWKLSDFGRAVVLGPMTGALHIGPIIDAALSLVEGYEPRAAMSPAAGLIGSLKNIFDGDVNLRDAEEAISLAGQALGGDGTALSVGANIWKQLRGLSNRIDPSDEQKAKNQDNRDAKARDLREDQMTDEQREAYEEWKHGSKRQRIKRQAARYDAAKKTGEQH